MFDIIIKNGTIIDGSGKEPYVASIGIVDDKIVEIGNIEDAECEKIIDATGKVITPGFIDVHSHGDATIMMFPNAESHLMQGITTFIGGLCGDSVAPLNDVDYFRNFWEYDNWYKLDKHLYSADLLQDAKKSKDLLKEIYGAEFPWHSFSEYLKYIDDNPTSINFVPLVGHSQLRVFSMGTISSPRVPTADERRVMRDEVEKAMDAGAWGFSTGLDYAPSKYALDDEIDEMIGAARKHGGIYSTHWRTSFITDDPDEKYPRTEGVRHACETALRNNVRMEISHLESAYEVYPLDNHPLNKAAAQSTLDIVDEYLEKGVDIVFNAPPNSTYGFKCIPFLAMHFAPLVKICGGAEHFAEMLKYPEYASEVIAMVRSGKSGIFGFSHSQGWTYRLRVVRSDIKEFEGQTIASISRKLGLDSLETVLELLRRDPYTNTMTESYSFDELEVFYSHPRSMVCLDGYIFDNKSTFGLNMDMPEILPNPTGYCGFPIFLTRYNNLSLPEKIHKITQSPAKWYGLAGRGLIEKGYFADINIIDMNTLDPMLDHIKAMVAPKGIEYVFVNGKVVVENGVHQGVHSGRVLRHM